MKLQDLVDTPELGIRALFGDPEALERRVGWTYTTDLLNPSRYLSHDQLVMTGLMWHSSPGDSETFVTALVEGGAVALIAGEGLLGYIPDDVVDACRRHGLPLLAVAPNVSFADITEHISHELASDRVTRLTSSLVRQRQMLAEVAAGQALDEVVMQVSRESGLPCWVLTSTGRSVVAGSGPFDPDDLDRVIAAALSRSRLPTCVEGPDVEPYSAFAVTGAEESRLTSWFIVVRGDHRTWSADVHDAIGELAAIASLDKARQESSREAWYEITDATLNLVTRDPHATDAARHLQQLGVDLSHELIVVTAGVVSSVDRQPEARWLLTDAVAHIGRPIVGLGVEGDVIGVLAVDDDHQPDAMFAQVSAAMNRIGPALRRERLTAGVSQPTATTAFGGALRSARYARHLAGDPRLPVQVVRSADVNSALVLINSVPDAMRRTFAEHVLGPVLEYDNRGGAELIATLRAFFACSGSWSKTADQLDLHLNTVRYRVARVEQLTHRDLSQVEDRLDLFLALHLL